jgi:hypothetical protein
MMRLLAGSVDGLMAEFIKIVCVLKDAKERGFEPLLGILPKPPWLL